MLPLTGLFEIKTAIGWVKFNFEKGKLIHG